MSILSKILVTFIFTTIIFASGYSQNKTSTVKNHILVSIEDSVRDRFMLGNDSNWLNTQLIFKKSISKTEALHRYKLVKVGKKKFTEGPHEKINQYYDSINFSPTQYGDSLIIILGEKFYTYIGNSSWGYQPVYYLQRLFPSHFIDFKPRDPNTCEHGWDMRRGQACYQCLHQYKLQYDSNYKKKHSLKLNKINSARFCEHGYDGHLGKACPQCLHKQRMSRDSNYRKAAYQIPIMSNCAHGHLCCQVKCPCCPKQMQIRILPDSLIKKK